MRRIIMGIGALLLAGASFANLTINIQQGVDKPYPIAIVPFSSSGFTKVIENDLGNSGRFGLLDPDQMPQKPHSAKAIKWGQWRDKTPMTEYVVVGKVSKDGGEYDVTYALASLYNRHVLYGQKFTHIAPSRMRNLAHFISDKIYQVITGQRGYFLTRLAYVSVEHKNGQNIYRLIISDSDGFDPRVLVRQYDNPIASPVWSPKGRRLAYVSYLNNRMAVYTIDINTGRRHLIANFEGINSAPAFSPDGSELAMALSKGGSSRTNLYLYNLNTKREIKLTRYGTNTSPDFSPDGQQIVFTSNRNGNPQIFQMNLKTHAVKLLTHTGKQNFSAKYLNNGQDIVFMRQSERGGDLNIAVMNINSGVSRIITDGSLDKSPSPAPNGQMVIYANYDNVRGMLAEVSINGKIQLQLPSTVGSVQSPAWSPYLT